MTTLLGIAICTQRKGAMHTLDAAQLTTHSGVEGDCRGKPGPRQVTLLSAAAWRQVCAVLDSRLEWTTRRANLLVDDLPLFESTGARIRLGEAVLEVTGEADPCQRMEQARAGLKELLLPDWRGGVTCRVLAGGAIHVGMPVAMQPAE